MITLLIAQVKGGSVRLMKDEDDSLWYVQTRDSADEWKAERFFETSAAARLYYLELCKGMQS